MHGKPEIFCHSSALTWLIKIWLLLPLFTWAIYFLLTDKYNGYLQIYFIVVNRVAATDSQSLFPFLRVVNLSGIEHFCYGGRY